MPTQRRRRLKLLLAAMAAVTATAATAISPALAASPAPSPASPSQGGAVTPRASDNITFGIGPAGPVGPAGKTDFDRRSNFSVLQARGGRATDYVGLQNLTYKPLRLSLYTADAVNSPDGSLGLQPRAVKPTDAATWVTLKTPNGTSNVVVPPRGRLFIPFTVVVPPNAFVGDHLAGIVASTTTQGQVPGDKSTDVKFEQRVAVRLAVRVAGVFRPQLTIENLTATYSGTLNPVGQGVAVVTYTVRNTGNIRLGGSQEVTVSGPLGSAASAADVPDVPLLLPGGSAALTVEVPQVRPTVYLKADVKIAALAPVGDADPIVEASTSSTHFWAVPWTLLATILVLGMLGGWYWRRRRMRPKPPPPTRPRRGREPGAASSVPDFVGSLNSLESAGPVA